MTFHSLKLITRLKLINILLLSHQSTGLKLLVERTFVKRTVAVDIYQLINKRGCDISENIFFSKQNSTRKSVIRENNDY